MTEQTEAASDAVAKKVSQDVLPPQEDGETTKDYLRRLRDENRRHREAHEAAETELKTIRQKLQEADTAKAEALDAVEKLKTSNKSQLAITKIETLATKEGILDTDVLEKLLDIEEFQFDEAGKITNAGELVQALKTAKPYLFGTAETARSEKAPQPADSKAKVATEMSDAAWAEHKKKYNL